MNSVIFYVTKNSRLTGSTINAIEYFLSGYEYNKELKLILVDAKKSFKRKTCYIIKDRYELNNIEGFYNNIVCMKSFKLPSLKLNKILVLDYFTISKLRCIINVNEILVISEKYTKNPKFFFDKKLYNVKYYGEMPFHYKDYDYRMKCLFSRYKKLKNVKVGTYINSPKNEHGIDIRNHLLLNEKLPKPFLKKSITNHKENLFEQFNTYLYFHGNKWFDPHPRLFLECTFYGKKIFYVNNYGVKDGSWYRNKDIKINGVKNRTLNKDDEIIRQLI